ncbi:MAG: uracil-DNA glycosylase family protein [Turneriella sp.]|nr:uracil-DNA glycosylase family protein [Leptospiraceae bacterium]MCX7631729.1 uracil-DNA glycosylase family protein [Turneriella sp.]
MAEHSALVELLANIRRCRHCEPHLPWGAKPVLRAHPQARILIAGQAPGTRVHETGIPWNDASGDRLRSWLQLSREIFYNEKIFAILPMGFCYPGKGKSGDNPPRAECAPLWRAQLHALLPELRLILAIGSYAVRYYLPQFQGRPLAVAIAETDYRHDCILPLVHPSPRNKLWLSQNLHFEKKIVPLVRRRVHALL